MAAHFEPAERLTAMHAEIADLVRVLGRFRWRLGLEQVLRFALRGVIASGLTLIGLLIAAWLMPIANWTDSAGLAAAPLLAALIVGVFRWPTERQAALAADRRLALEERLGTAVELASRFRSKRAAGGRFDRLQVRDAVARARGAPKNTWLALDRRETLAALAVSVLAALSLMLPSLPRPGLSTVDQTPAMLDVVPSAETQDRVVLADPTGLSVANEQSLQQTPFDADLATRVQQQQAERAALDTLAQAVGRISAGQAAADAIQRGDFAAARDQLANLGEQADQLSDAAKQQLSQALQQAATATAATDKPLADRERQAAQALSRNTYADQRQALQNLADQAAKSGARTTSADQLARDVGRLQQQSAGQTAGSQGAKAQAQGPQGQAQGNAAANAASQAGGDGQSGAGANGQQAGPGVGTGINPDALGDQSSRLDTAGQRVEVPAKLGTGPGVRPPDGTEDQTGTDPSAPTRSVSELVQSQQTGQVAPEQNLVPGEQRPVVQGYFR